MRGCLSAIVGLTIFLGIIDAIVLVTGEHDDERLSVSEYNRQWKGQVSVIASEFEQATGQMRNAMAGNSNAKSTVTESAKDVQRAYRQISTIEPPYTQKSFHRELLTAATVCNTGATSLLDLAETNFNDDLLFDNAVGLMNLCATHLENVLAR